MAEEKYMRLAISLAKRGEGFVNPNPLVGAVIVKDKEVIAKGWHEKYGGLHAERNALEKLSQNAKGAEMYVTLEPCCHFGKQPPCTDAIIKSGIRKVVVGSRDPNPLVAGKGIKILKDAGIEVEEDFLRDECDSLNPVFFHYITTKTPYVVMKYAMTADGKIATYTKASKWITSEESRMHVQKMRCRYSSIMAGIGTVLADDPMLTVREPGFRSPFRIICDSSLRIPKDCKIVKSADKYKTFVACALSAEALKEDGSLAGKKKFLEKAGIEILCLPDPDGKVSLTSLMKHLGELSVDSILLEGGGTLNYSALKSGIVNEVAVFVAPKIFGGRSALSPVSGEGVRLPYEAPLMELYNVRRFKDDILLSYRLKKPSADG